MTLKPPGAANSPLLEFEPVIATDYGVRGNGTSDDTSALQAAISAAASLSKELLIPAGTYKITSTLIVPSSASLRGEPGRTILDFSAQTSTFTAMTATGTASAGSVLSGNATAGDLTLTVSNTGFSDGDWCLIGSTAVTGNTNVPKGERVRIQTASSMTLYDTLADSYATADTATLYRISDVQQVTLSGLYFKGPTDSTLDIFGLNFDRVRELSIADCVFEKTHRAAITLTENTAVRIHGCHFKQIEKSGLAYGIVLQNATQDVSIVNCTGQRLRHMVTHGGLTSRNGVPRRTVTMGCVASQSIEGAFDTHPGTEDISFIGNTCFGSDQDGIIHQGRSGVIANNTIERPARHGILVQHLTNGGLDVVVANNQIRQAGSRGVIVTTSASFTDIRGVNITGNTVDGCLIGIEMDSLALAVTNTIIANNSIRNATSTGLNINAATFSTVSGNVVYYTSASVVGIYCRGFTDGVVSGNLIRAGSATGTVGLRVGTNASAVASSGMMVSGNRITGPATGILFDATTTDSSAVGNRLTGCTTAVSLSTGTGNVAANNTPGVIATVASAGTIALPASESGIYNISGTTNIDTITATSMAGRIVVLKTAGILTFGDGTGNLKLSAAYTTTADDTLTLYSDGTSFWEIARSVN